MALLGFAGYLMFQLNNVNALIRIFSRMVSCSYLVLMTMAFFLFEDIANSIISVLAIAFYIFFFSIYQEEGCWQNFLCLCDIGNNECYICSNLIFCADYMGIVIH